MTAEERLAAVKEMIATKIFSLVDAYRPSLFGEDGKILKAAGYVSSDVAIRCTADGQVSVVDRSGESPVRFLLRVEALPPIINDTF